MMRTAEEWLALDDLRTELAKVLTPGKSKHYCRSHLRDAHWVYICDKCGREYDGRELDEQGIYAKCWNIFSGIEHDCPVPDAITIDWNTAMEWFRKAPKTDGTIKIMHKVYRWATGIRATLDLTVLAWLLEQADAKMLLIIAAMAAERKER